MMRDHLMQTRILTKAALNEKNYGTSKKINDEESSESIKKINTSRWDRQKHSICGQRGNSDRDETSPATPKCASESHKSQIEAKETKSTAHEATDIVGNAKILKNPNITFTMHADHRKAAHNSGSTPTRRTKHIKYQDQCSDYTVAPQMKAMTSPQIVMMNATCNT